MADKFLEIEDLTQEVARDFTLDLKCSAEERAELQVEADKRGVPLEEYLRWKLLTAAAVGTAGGNSMGGGGAA